MNFLEAYQKAVLMADELNCTDTMYLYRPSEEFVIKVKCENKYPITYLVPERNFSHYDKDNVLLMVENGVFVTTDDILANDWIVSIRSFVYVG